MKKIFLVFTLILFTSCGMNNQVVNKSPDSSVELAGTSKIVLETGDKIQLKGSAASDLEAFISVLQIT